MLGLCQSVKHIRVQIIDEVTNQYLPNYYIRINKDTLNSDVKGQIYIRTIADSCIIVPLQNDLSFNGFRLFITKDTNFIVYVSKFSNIKAVKLKYQLPNEIKINENILTLSQKFLTNLSLPLATNDPIHLLKFLPGVSTSQEMNSGLNIRGANYDNTTIYIDHIPVPNVSHSFGLISLFDMGSIRHIDYYTNNVPSTYGGRGSSYIKFHGRDPSLKDFHGDVFISPFVTSFNTDLRLKKDKLAISLGFRQFLFSKFYNDLVPLFSDFNDQNVKLKYLINDKSLLRLSFLKYTDKLNAKFNFGLPINDTIKWNYRAFGFNYTYFFPKSKTLEVTGFYNNFNINNFAQSDFEKINRTQKEYNLKAQISTNSTQKYKLDYGLETSFRFTKSPSDIFGLLNQQKLIISVFADQKYIWNKVSIFLNSRLNQTNDKILPIPEMRLRVQKKLTKSTFGIELNQYVNFYHTLTNNLIPIPIDFKFLSNNQFKPQQINEGLLTYKMFANKITFSSILFYRNHKNSLDLKTLNQTNDVNPNNISGVKHTSYGLELFSSINIDKRNMLNIGYTYSRAFLKSSNINLGLLYPANYDRPHNLNALYKFTLKRFSFTATFTVQSGRPITLPLFLTSSSNIPVFSLRNEERLPLFHKLDVGFFYKFNEKGKVIHSLQLNFYNIYFRKNIYAIIWATNPNPTSYADAYQFYYFSAFPFLPSLSYHLRF